MAEGVSDARIAEIDRVFTAREAAIVEWAEALPGTPEDEAGARLEAAAQAVVDALTGAIWAEPVTQWAQLGPLARIAEHWLQMSKGTVCADCDEATRQLIEGVRALTGLTDLPPVAQ